MQINSNQIEIFNNGEYAGFLERLVVFVGKEYPDFYSAESIENLKKWLTVIIDKARGYSIDREYNIHKLTGLFIAYNLRYPLHKKLSDFMSNSDLHEDIKIDRFFIALQSGNFQKKEFKVMY